MKALIKGRNRAIQQIRKAGGGRTCFGKWISTASLAPHRIAAQISQAIELKIIHPLFVCAKNTDDFTITLFLHDGVGIHFTDKSKVTRWKRRLNDLVVTAAEQFGAETELEWE